MNLVKPSNRIGYIGLDGDSRFDVVSLKGRDGKPNWKLQTIGSNSGGILPGHTVEGSGLDHADIRGEPFRNFPKQVTLFALTAGTIIPVPYSTTPVIGVMGSDLPDNVFAKINGAKLHICVPNVLLSATTGTMFVAFIPNHLITETHSQTLTSESQIAEKPEVSLTLRPI